MKKILFSKILNKRKAILFLFILGLVCFSPIIGMIIAYHDDVVLMKGIAETGIVVAFIVIIWNEYIKLKDFLFEDDDKEKKIIRYILRPFIYLTLSGIFAIFNLILKNLNVEFIEKIVAVAFVTYIFTDAVFWQLDRNNLNMKEDDKDNIDS